MTPSPNNADDPTIDDDGSEEFETTLLERTPRDDQLPGVNAFIDSPHMLNVEDPSILADGSVADDDELIRTWREQPDDVPDQRADIGLRLPDSRMFDGYEPSIDGYESDTLADNLSYTDNPSAEEAAMHIEGEEAGMPIEAD